MPRNYTVGWVTVETNRHSPWSQNALSLVEERRVEEVDTDRAVCDHKVELLPSEMGVNLCGG